MDEYIYRYISFETFVGMVQSQALTFVQPMLWEDPQESSPFRQFIEGLHNEWEQLVFTACYFKTFGQCWTRLSESDAMWRIYSYNKKAIRVKIKKDALLLLDNVDAIDVTYQDTVFEYQDEKDIKKDYLRALCQKRIAFQHEQEIRLIHHYRFLNDEDFDRHVKAVMAISDHPQKMEALKSLFPDLTIEEQVDKTCRLLNVGKNKQAAKHISFTHIPDFICGVMIHPQADDWYVKVVEDFCRINSIPFEGKSQLYKK